MTKLLFLAMMLVAFALGISFMRAVEEPSFTAWLWVALLALTWLGLEVVEFWIERKGGV